MQGKLSRPGYTRRYISEAGGWVEVHETHGKLEVRQNLPVAVFLADLGEQVRLLPVSRVQGAKNPDATRNELEWEFKSPEGRTANAINKALRIANRQATRVLIQLSAEFDHRLIEEAIYNRVRRASNIIEVAIFLSNRLYHFSRMEILDNTFRGKMS